MLICPSCRKPAPDEPSTCPECGQPTTIGGLFTLTEQVDRAAAHTVWRGRDDNGRPLRIEELVLHRFDDAAIQQLKSQIGKLTGLEPPHHARFIDACFEEDRHRPPRCWAVFEQPGGTTLAERLAEGLFDEKEALRVLVAVARALAWHHTRPTARVHGAIHTGNVVFVGGKKVVLTGHSFFESAVRATLTGPLAAPESDGLVAPELRDDPIGGRTPTADVYALGGLLLDMLSPEHACELAEPDGTVRWRHVADLDTKSSKLLPHLLHPDPAERLTDGVAVLRACGRLSDVAAFDVLVVDDGKKGSLGSLHDALDAAGTDTAIVLRPGTWQAVPRLVGTQRILGSRWHRDTTVVELEDSDTATLEHKAGLHGLTLRGPSSDPALRMEGGEVRVSHSTLEGGARGVQLRDGLLVLHTCAISGATAVEIGGRAGTLVDCEVTGKAAAVSITGGGLVGKRGWWHAEQRVIEASGDATCGIQDTVLGPAGTEVLVARDKATIDLTACTVQGADCGQHTEGDGTVRQMGGGYVQLDRPHSQGASEAGWPRRNVGVWGECSPPAPVADSADRPVKGTTSKELVDNAARPIQLVPGELRSPLSKAQAEAILRASVREMKEAAPTEEHNTFPSPDGVCEVVGGELLHAWVLWAGSDEVLVGPRHFDTPPRSLDDDLTTADGRPRWSDDHRCLSVSPAALDPWLAVQGARFGDLDASLRSALEGKVDRIGLPAGLLHHFDEVLLDVSGNRHGAAASAGPIRIKVIDDCGVHPTVSRGHPLMWEAGAAAGQADAAATVKARRLTWARVWGDLEGSNVGVLVGDRPKMLEGFDFAETHARTWVTKLKKQLDDLKDQPQAVRNHLDHALIHWPFIGGDPDGLVEVLSEWTEGCADLNATEAEVDRLCGRLRSKKTLVAQLGDKGLTPERVRSAFERGAAIWMRDYETRQALDKHFPFASKALGAVAVVGVVGIIISALMPEPPPPPPPPPTPASTVMWVSEPKCISSDRIKFRAQADGVGKMDLVLAETAASHPTKDGWFEIHSFRKFNNKNVAELILKQVRKPDQVASGSTLFKCTDKMLARLTYEVYLYNESEDRVECVMWGHQPGFSGTHEVTGVTVSGHGCRTITPTSK